MDPSDAPSTTAPLSLSEIGADIDWPDSESSTIVRDRLAGAAGLGRLASLAEWTAGVRPPGSELLRARLLIVGERPSELVLETAAALGVEVSSVEVGAAGTSAAGSARADAEIESGTDLLLVAVPQARADAAVAVSALTNTEPVKVLARGVAAVDPEAWMQRAVDVRDARRRCMPVRDDPDQLLAQIGSPRLAVAAGLVLRAAARRTPVVLDGPVAMAAALIAYEAQPRAVRWWAAADLGDDPMHELALTRLGQRAILGLETGQGDGLAALLAIPVIRAALRLAGPSLVPVAPPDSSDPAGSDPAGSDHAGSDHADADQPGSD